MGAVDGAVVLVRAVVELDGLADDYLDVVALEDESVGAAALQLPVARARRIECAAFGKLGAELDEVGEVLDFLVAALDKLYAADPLLEIVGTRIALHDAEGLYEVVYVGQLAYLKFQHGVADGGDAGLHVVVERLV